MNDQADVAVAVRGITKTYGGVHALDDVSIELRRGHVHCLAGENGSGKSTLIKLISGVERPDGGTIEIDGDAARFLTPARAIHAGIQVIYQDFSLFPNLTVRENIALGAELARRAALYRRARATESAQRVIADLGLTLDLDAEVGSLPVADRQLVAICRALVHDARVLIFDEPTTALTHTEVERLLAVIRRLQERGVAIVFVSHKLEEVLAVSDEVTVLRNGKLVAEGPASEFDRRTLTNAMTGHEVDESRRPAVPQSDAPLLEVEGLSVKDIVRDVSFQVRHGEVLGITGLLGSGRGEITEALFGVLPTTAGTVTLDGARLRIRSIRDAVNAGIGYVPEDRLTQGLFLDQPISDNIIAASLKQQSRGPLLVVARVREVVTTLFQRLRIKARDPRAVVRSLSGGNAQRVVIAKWLATKPRLLMLNGPTVGVDVGSKDEILGILRQEAATGMGVIVVSDDLPELISVCTRILVVRQGRIVAEFTGDDIDASQVQERMAA
ncbi:sugar ABC transporter ATP-binding protein [Microbacterium lacticum]